MGWAKMMNESTDEQIRDRAPIQLIAVTCAVAVARTSSTTRTTATGRLSEFPEFPEFEFPEFPEFEFPEFPEIPEFPDSLEQLVVEDLTATKYVGGEKFFPEITKTTSSRTEWDEHGNPRTQIKTTETGPDGVTRTTRYEYEGDPKKIESNRRK